MPVTNVCQTFIAIWINVCQMFVIRIRLTNVWRAQLCSSHSSLDINSLELPCLAATLWFQRLRNLGTGVLRDLKQQNARPIFWKARKFKSKSAKMHFQCLHCQSTRNTKKPLQNQCLSFQIVRPISYLFCRLKNGQDADHCHLLFPSSCPKKIFESVVNDTTGRRRCMQNISHEQVCNLFWKRPHVWSPFRAPSNKSSKPGLR